MQLLDKFKYDNKLSVETIDFLKEQYPRFFQDGKKRNEWKNYLVIIHVTQTGCKKCKELSKHVYIDDVFSKGKPTLKYRLLSQAIKEGVLLDGCHTSIYTYFEGINTHPRLKNR